MDYNNFIQKLSQIKKVESVTGKIYHSIDIRGDCLYFIRGHKSKSEKIYIPELYSFFVNEKHFITSIAKDYISGRVQSPAVAILKELKSGNLTKTNPSITNESNNFFTSPIKNSVKIKDETKFFEALSELIGEKYLISKSIGKPVNSKDIFLSSNYIDYNFKEKILHTHKNILKDLQANGSFASKSLSNFIDGIIVNHPMIGNRIVEFDEEQHFTPARFETLKHLKKILPDNYFSKYQNICTDINYLNHSVLKKHRIKNKLQSVPKSFKNFIKWLDQSNEKISGYIKNKNGFDFIGGRIAQRAYYDSLRDTAHLSEKNTNYLEPLRFAKKEFEDITKMKFSEISNSEIKKIIEKILNQDYKITIK